LEGRQAGQSGGLAGRAVWKAVFPNKRHEFRRVVHKTRGLGWTKGQSGGLFRSPLARPFVQPAGPTFCAAR